MFITGHPAKNCENFSPSNVADVMIIFKLGDFLPAKRLSKPSNMSLLRNQIYVYHSITYIYYHLYVTQSDFCMISFYHLNELITILYAYDLHSLPFNILAMERTYVLRLLSCASSRIITEYCLSSASDRHSRRRQPSVRYLDSNHWELLDI